METDALDGWEGGGQVVFEPGGYTASVAIPIAMYADPPGF